MRFLSIICLFVSVFGWSADYSIVFVQLGDTLPGHIIFSIDQARLFNKNADIYLIANQKAVEKFRNELSFLNGLEIVYAESLPIEKEHALFKKQTKLDRVFRNGFWMFATERFFYLHALMKQKKLNMVFHLESDVMLYMDLSHSLEIFKQRYQGMLGVTFDNLDRCIPGFVFVSSLEPLSLFTKFIVEKSHLGTDDMYLLGKFKSRYFKKRIDSLPILVPEYAQDHPLISALGHIGDVNCVYFNHFDQFQSVFDAAALGQYLGGIDPANGVSEPGFINESCIFNPSYYDYQWEKDEQGRAIPYLIYKGQKYKINNLHIHCKDLRRFHSQKGDRI